MDCTKMRGIFVPGAVKCWSSDSHWLLLETTDLERDFGRSNLLQFGQDLLDG
jgi:hypothetical protein